MDSQECEEAYVVSTSVVLKIILVVKISTCAASIFANIRIVGKKCISWLGHPNAKFLFAAHIASTIAMSLTFGVIHVIDLVRLTLPHSNHCEYLVPILLPLIARSAAVAFVYCQILTMVGLAIERCFATAYMQRYEKIKSNKQAKVATFIFTLFSFCYCYAMFVPGNDYSDSVPTMVLKTDENATRFKIVAFGESIPVLSTLFLFHFILWKSDGKVDTTKALSSKYQIRENRKIVVVILPIVYLFFVIFLVVSFGFTFVVAVWPNMDSAKFAIANELVSIIIFYGLFLPIFIDWRIKRKKQFDLEDLKSHGANHFLSIDELVQTKKRYERNQERTFFKSFCSCLICK